jgi:crotonobetainyl-CoA:carnitine CoA-transferase CaiB-like acyl-CoA transferase
MALHEQGEDAPPAGGPLAGIRVLDLTQMLAGPMCTMRLGDLGADVLKVEPPGRGEWVRDKLIADVSVRGQAPSLLALNRNKRSVTVNLKHEDGRAALYALARQSDVLIQNFSLGTVERLGLGYERLRRENERLVYCAISGYGERGPYASRPGQDLVVQGYTGSLWAVGRRDDPPQPNALWAVDVMTGYQAAVGVLAALRARDVTGRGQKVELDMLSVAMDCQAQELVTHLHSGLLPERTGEHTGHAFLPSPYGVHRTADGWLTLAHAPVESLAEATGDGELARLATLPPDARDGDELRRALADVLRRQTTDHWLERLLAAGVWAGPVYTYADLVADPHVAATGAIVDVPHPDGGTFRMPAIPMRLSETSPSIRSGPPLLGQHTDEVLGELLGYPRERLDQLRSTGAI